MLADLALLRHIDAYLDAAPRTAARAEEIGPFTLFVNEGHGWRYYARPTPGEIRFTVAAVRAVRERQRELSQPEAFEWITELTPEVGDAAEADGMRIVHHPLMVRPLMVRSGDLGSVPVPDGVAVVDADDDLASINAVADVAFAHPGTTPGVPGHADATAAANAQSPDTIAFQRGRMLAGLTVAVTARVSGAIAAVGWHQPVSGSSEVVGVATLPAFRRRGLATAVTAMLVVDAHERGVDTVFLSADDDDVSRIYERVGFRRIGAAGAASVPTG